MMKVSEMLRIVCRLSSARIVGVQKLVGFDLGKDVLDLSGEEFEELKEALK